MCHIDGRTIAIPSSAFSFAVRNPPLLTPPSFVSLQTPPSQTPPLQTPPLQSIWGNKECRRGCLMYSKDCRQRSWRRLQRSWPLGDHLYLSRWSACWWLSQSISRSGDQTQPKLAAQATCYGQLSSQTRPVTPPPSHLFVFISGSCGQELGLLDQDLAIVLKYIDIPHCSTSKWYRLSFSTSKDLAHYLSLLRFTQTDLSHSDWCIY